ncbi:MOXD1 homolog 2 [Tribolium castaneum]|uniref:MOXD1 homolog 2-like Protein n=1 Tax=Tribolium castaneum TaxID=7070 RepID=D6WLD0_TRICA|nr:PREDICTED: MOXD1 homolog 2 [Tribolium castaneum]EFA04095.2 MOXD1 homolog 2-like Protein [Tribolium castaneum]|eukprot:XP_008193742.1 PREDICTED: MOXD1 homolog 2 [Tribolium castaneum]
MVPKLVQVLSVLCVVQYGKAARWSHSAMLSPDYRLLWSLGPGPQDITFELQVRTLGYVGFGFSKDGRMTGADMVVGWVDKGQVYFQDRHVKDSPVSSRDREPEVDPSQDYQLLLGYENHTHTVLRFRRKLDTCDHHDIPITNDTMRVVWAFHSEEPVGGSVGPNSLPQHDVEFRGTQSLYLVQRADQEAPGPEETARIWELRNPAVEPPAPAENLYWCRVFKIPVITKKHHLIRYEPLQGIRGPTGLQHVVLYECQDSPQVAQLADTPGRQCYEPHTQPLSCNTVVASWARGSEGFSFPPEAGYPLEPATSRYYLLETHYISPTDGSLGSLDGSGLRLYYTPELRRHDAGVISIGMDPNWRHIIPPGQQRVVSSGHCVSECTKQAFPHNGINMFAVVMKTHRIGRQVALKHIRGNVEQPPIAADDNLDADYQEYRRLGIPVKILPGDHLIAECTYNSSGRTAITLGGLTSREETCLVMGLYYPKQRSLAACHSLPSLPTVLHSLGIQELSPGSNPVRIAAPPELAGMTLESRLVSYDWDNHFHNFQEATMKGSFKPLCRTAQSTILPGTDKEFHYPNITIAYVRNNADQCNSYKRYSTEGWPGGTPVMELEGNHIEGAARSKVSRSSSSPTAEESLGLSRVNSACRCYSFQTVLVLCVLLVWSNH